MGNTDAASRESVQLRPVNRPAETKILDLCSGTPILRFVVCRAKYNRASPQEALGKRLSARLTKKGLELSYRLYKLCQSSEHASWSVKVCVVGNGGRGVGHA